MRFTNVLFKQPIMFNFRLKWLHQRKRVPVQDKVEERLLKMGIETVDPLTLIKPPRNLPHVEPTISTDKYLQMGENHLLVEGTEQAQVITKSVIINDKLPDKITSLVENTDVSDDVHYQVKKTILSAHLFDSEQLKLPKLKPPPDRPAWNHKRVYGISDRRRNSILTNKLLTIIERNADLGLTLERQLTQDIDSSVTVEKDSELIHLDQHTNMFVSSLRALPPIADASVTLKKALPDLHPINHTVTLIKTGSVKSDVYPINLKQSRVYHPHTLFLHFNETECTNLHELEVREHQICGRTLMHAFTIAAAYAKEMYGDVKSLPFPVTLQCVQSNGHQFHFGVLQLNTLELSGTDGVKNIWWSMPRIRLFDECGYREGIPVLTNYNLKVYKYLNAFYNNQ